ncbi:MAG: hypothetical protein HEQ32_01970 [Vampirovibrio sp.]
MNAEILVKTVGGRLINGEHHDDGAELLLHPDLAHALKRQGLVTFEEETIDDTLSDFQDTNLDLLDQIKDLEADLQEALQKEEETKIELLACQSEKAQVVIDIDALQKELSKTKEALFKAEGKLAKAKEDGGNA